MRTTRFPPIRLLPVLALAIPAAAIAQTAGTPPATPMTMPRSMDPGQAPCPATPAALPPEFAGWNAAVPIAAATVPSALADATITPGRGVRATLSPTGGVTYRVPPGNAGAPGTSGGLLAFTIGRPGTYRIGLGAGAWIDVVKDGHAIASTAHGHGPACGPIRKTVDFALRRDAMCWRSRGTGPRRWP